MRTHRLKTLATYFQLSAMGLKPYEIRLNDRLYQQGDVVELYCIKKTKRGDIEVMRNDGIYINWPKYGPDVIYRDAGANMSMAGQHVPLDNMSPQSRAQLACIRAIVLFVLPGTDDIGMHSDHVLLTLQQIEYTGPRYLENKGPTLFDMMDKMSKEPAFGQERLPIPQGVVWNKTQHEFYNTLGHAMPLGFKNSWLDRKDEFPHIVDALDPDKQATVFGEVAETIPEGVYYGPDGNNFYSVDDNKGMGVEFWNKWKHRKDDFPRRVEEPVKRTKGEGKSLLREATTAPVEGQTEPTRYKPKGFA